MLLKAKKSQEIRLAHVVLEKNINTAVGLFRNQTIDSLKWNGLAKKSGVETGDVISEFKIENLERPNKANVYPFALMLLFGFGYLNYKRDKKI